jgi:PAS domain S-box-containing protein
MRLRNFIVDTENSHLVNSILDSAEDLNGELLSRLHSRSIFPLIASLTSHPVMVSDVNGGTVWVNEAFERQSGWLLREIRGLRPSDFLHGPDTCPTTVKIVEQQTSLGVAFHYEILNYHRNGSTYWLSLDAQPILKDDGGLVGYFSIRSDVSSRRAAEDENRNDRDLLKLMSDALTRFISNDDSQEAFADTLDQLLKLTRSEYGFIGDVKTDEKGSPYLHVITLTDISWNKETKALYQKSLQNGFEFQNLNTLFGAAIRSGQPLISESPSTDDRSGGLPPGHPPLNRFLALPVWAGDELVGLVGLANSEVPYSEKLVQFLQPAVLCLGQLIEARRREILRKATEASLREAEEMLNKTGEIAAIGAWQMDLVKKTLRWSRQTRLIHEVSEDFEPKLDLAIGFYHEDAQRTIADAVRLAIETGQPWDLELPFVTARGRHRWARAIGHVEMKDGKAVRLYGSFQDITERRQADAERERLQSQFIQSQKLESVGRLAGGIAHDFNNMLAVILGHTEMLLLDSTLSAAQRAHLKAIQTASQRSADMTHQLLTFARRQAAAPQKLDLNKTVRQLLGFLRKSVHENIRIDWVPGDPIWTVSIDPVQVDQMLALLCMNSREAMPKGGQILISTRNERIEELRGENASRVIVGDYVVLTLSDNGPGISRDVVLRLYEPFTTTKPVGQGPGLGLATVYGIVQQNDGAIDIESDSMGGTTVRIYLPRVETNKEAASKTDTSLQPSSQLSILLIEDEPALKKLGKMFLQQLGHKVTTTESGEEALKLLGTGKRNFSLVITDMVLAGMSGEDLAKRALQIQRNLRFVVMTGHSQADPSVRQSLRDVPWLTKPFDLQQLAQAIRQAMS